MYNNGCAVRASDGPCVETGSIPGRMVIRMKTLAEHHWSAETILGGFTVLGILVGAIVGYLAGMAIQNVGAAIPLGALVGLIVGLIVGMKVSANAEL